MQQDPIKSDELNELQSQVPTEMPDDIDDQIKDSFLKRLLKSIGRFLFKYKWVIVGSIAFVVLAIFSLYNFINIIVFNDVKLVNLGTVVEIKDGQTIKNKVQNVSVKVSNFVNETCPADKKCFGDGSKSVEYIMTVDGQSHATGSSNEESINGFKIKTVDSDYKTYANIQIIESK